MEPISATIVAALVGGAAAALEGVATQAVTDSYAAIKRLIIDRYKRQGALQTIEEDPTSETGQQALKEMLEKTRAVDDPEIIAKAKSLTEALSILPPELAAGAGLDIERLKAANARFKNIEARGTAIHIRDTEVTGTFEAENIRGGLKNE